MKSFASDTRGNVVLIFAFGLVMLLSAVAGAIDFGRAYSAKRKLQAALDSAVLAAAASSKPDRLDNAATVFQQNFHSAGITGASPQFTLNGSNQVVGTANLSLRSSFLQVLGMQSIPVTATSIAASTYSNVINVTFEATKVQGWFAKDIYAFMRDADGNIVQEVKVLSYDYNRTTNSKTVVPPLDTTSQTYTLSGGSTFGVKMRVWPDYDNVGSRSGPHVDFYSDDKDARIRTKGECETGQEHAWEDGGDSNFKDFVYNMTCTSRSGSIAEVRLVQ